MKKTPTHAIPPRNIRRLYPQIKTVMDARQSLAVEVMPEDCVSAVSLDANECALARAMRREYHADVVIIGLNTSYVLKGTKAIRFATGERIAREVVSFDRHHDFEPGHYKLMPPRPSQRIEARRREQRHDPRPRHDTNTPKVGTARVRLLTARDGVR